MKKLISLFLFLFLFLAYLYVFSSISEASETEYPTGLEGIIGKSYFDDSYYNITRITGTSVISDINKHSGLLSYYCPTFPFQFKISFKQFNNTDNFIIKFNTWSLIGGTATTRYDFYSSEDILCLRFDVTKERIVMATYGSSITTYFYDKSSGIWQNWGFTILGGQSVFLYVNDIVGNYSTGSPFFGNIQGIKLKNVFIYSSDGVFLIDDMNYTINNEYESGGSMYGDVSAYQKIITGREGYLYISLLDEYQTKLAGIIIDSGLLGSTYIQNKINSQMNIAIKAVDLYIGMGQYEIAYNLSDYTMFINGVSIGNPNYFIPSDYGYKIRWIYFTKTLDNENPIIEFSCNKYVSYSGLDYYWYSVPTDPTIPYGNYQFKHHVITDLFGLGIYPSIDWFPDLFLETGTQYRIETHNNGLAMDMYYLPIEPPSEFENNTIFTDKNLYQEYDNIQITGTVNSLSNNYYIKIFNSTGQINGPNNVFSGIGNLVLPSNTGFFQDSYFATDNDSYIACLQLAGVNVSQAFFNVTERPDKTYLINTYRNPCNPFEVFDIWYTYTDSIPGSLIVSLHPYLDNSFLGILDNNIISGNHHITWSYGSQTVLYLFLAENLGNGTFISKFSYPQYVGVSFGTGIFYIGSDSLTLDINGQAKMHIWGINYNPSLYCVIYDNVNHLNTLGYTQNFDFYFTYYDTGNIEINMDLIISPGNTITVHTENFIIYPYVPLTPQEQQNAINNILIGLAITVLIMLIPIVFSIYGANISMPIYLLFLFIGCVICSIIGLFPAFIPASIIVCEILGLIVLKFWR